MMVVASVACAKEVSLEDGGIGRKQDEKRTTLRSRDVKILCRPRQLSWQAHLEWKA